MLYSAASIRGLKQQNPVATASGSDPAPGSRPLTPAREAGVKSD
jgi:hypothetical protein